MPGTFSYASSTNIVTVTGGTSGSPADFASFVAADRAGTGTSLLAAWSPNNNTKALTYQIRPVELLALLISFVVASKTAETDYIYVTGIDWLGNAQTESINVSAGNGTYVTTKRFRTITNIDCSDNAAGGGTVWADGTVAVTQPIWGVIWNKGSSQYQLDCFVSVGDGSISTYFADLNKQIVLSNITTAASQGFFVTKLNATLRFGEVVDAGTKSTRNGCDIICLATNYNYPIIIYGVYNGPGIELYSCSFYGAHSNTYIYASAGSKVWNCLSRFQVAFAPSTWSAATADWFNNTLCGGQGGFSGYGTINKITVIGAVNGLWCSRYDGKVISNPYIRNCTNDVYMFDNYSDNYIVNGDIISWNIAWNYNKGGKLYRQYTFDVHLVDVAGVNISGATVTLKDKNASTVFSLTTGADGKITSQTVSRGTYEFATGSTLQDLSPHTLTITKAGYQDYTDVITLDRKMDLEVAMKRPQLPLRIREDVHAVC